NVNPTRVFTYSATPGQGLFSDLEALVNDLEAGKSGQELNGYLSYIDKHIDNVLAERAELGARSNRLELMEARVDEQEVIAQQILSDNE
ncbi:flagellar hook-associated protein FlgL, partial [Anoxybacillus sp. LAT27]|nr:flagellar hook-associated protein FlgL [Anoxybacillus sp. LAT27]